WLFKEARENTGEDWSEKVASEIAALLGVSTHRAELAIWEGRRGCAVRSFLDPGKQFLVHGNELLGGIITGYDKAKLRGQADHTFDNIVAVLERLFRDEKARTLAASRMAGYVVLDALTGNTDRHHENWGIVLEPRGTATKRMTSLVQLAPTFDHASSLGRELTDDAREEHLRRGTLERYIRKGRGGIYASPDARHGMSPLGAAEMLAQRYPAFFRPWQERVAAIEGEKCQQLIQRVPSGRMSEAARAFAVTFLCASRKALLKVL
ncbi:MAG TPA: HipA domain-containing protein, partial [Chthoniobacteraceae bacterium]|nr:HipA domain-containing protein [Chthoniobacteraceae bacterium]